MAVFSVTDVVVTIRDCRHCAGVPFLLDAHYVVFWHPPPFSCVYRLRASLCAFLRGSSDSHAKRWLLELVPRTLPEHTGCLTRPPQTVAHTRPPFSSSAPRRNDSSSVPSCRSTNTGISLGGRQSRVSLPLARYPL